MIPMSDWFARRRSRHSVDELFPILVEAGDLEPDDDIVQPGSDALQKSRDEGYRIGLAEAERATAYVHAQEKEALEAHHRETLSAMERQCAQLLADQISCGLRAMATELAASLTGVLGPFLDRAVRERAVGRLVEMVEEEIMRKQNALLEISAPSRLHERLSGILSERGLSAALVEGDPVVVTCRAERVVFEDLAERWITHIRGNEG